MPKILGDRELWNDAVIRIALRENLKREPLVEDFTEFVEEYTSGDYTALAQKLGDTMFQYDRWHSGYVLFHSGYVLFHLRYVFCGICFFWDVFFLGCVFFGICFF